MRNGRQFVQRQKKVLIDSHLSNKTKTGILLKMTPAASNLLIIDHQKIKILKNLLTLTLLIN